MRRSSSADKPGAPLIYLHGGPGGSSLYQARNSRALTQWSGFLDQGDVILLRLSNLAVVRHYTLTANGLPMQVVGRGARLLRGQGQAVGDNVYYETNAVNLGGGESTDVLIDTAGVATGTYFLYSSNLNYLSNNDEDYGGMMTEIVIN